MVRSKALIADDIVTNFVNEPLGSYEIIETPTDVFSSCVHHVRPKGVFFFFLGIKMPEGIYKVFFEKIIKAISFFFCKTSVLKLRWKNTYIIT